MSDAEREERKPSAKGRRNPYLTAVKWLASIVLGLVALAGLLLVWLNTDPGRRLVADQISNFEFANGMRVGVDRIEGSLYSDSTIHGLTLWDTRGVFFRAPVVRLDWHPFDYLNNHVDIRSLVAPTAILLRAPIFRATPPSEGPLLPDLDITIGRLRVDRLIVEPAVTGERRVGSIEGKARIADRRAQLRLKAETIAEAGRPGGDRLALVLDAVPEQNRLALNLLVNAPAHGVLTKLAGFSEALALRVRGRGDWQRWNGQLAANLAGAPLARLSLSARDGTFAIQGPTRISRLLAGPSSTLLGPIARVTLRSTWNERVAEFNGSLASDAFRLVTSGTADLGRNRLQDVRVNLALERPGAVLPNLSGRNVRAQVVLDGAMRRPDIDYRVQAERLAFDDMAVIGLDARGAAAFRDDHIAVPIAASARAITGLETLAGGTITNVRLSGDLAVDWPRILSDNLRIRSDRIDGTAVILANASTGLYTGTIKGRIDNYRVESVGIFKLQTNADLRSTSAGLSLTGRIRARSTRLFNESVRNFLGGNFLASTDVTYGPDGTIRFSNLRLRAPLLRVTDGRGTYARDGRVNIRATGVSQKYGQVGVEITGTASNPNAVVTASRPDLGLGLSEVRAEVRSTDRGFELRARGATDYGPFTANVVLRTGAGPMTIDVREATLAGISVEGRVRQSAAGPFVGRLDASGQGIDGSVVLAAARQTQQIVVDLQARSTVLPPPANIAVGFASIDARITLYDRPEVIADVQLSNATFGGTDIRALRAIVDYRGGVGSAKMIAEGSTGVPFRVALNSELQPNLWRVALRGRVNGVDFRTAAPARIVPRSGSYQLLPTRVDFDQGRLLLAGSYGQQLQLRARAEDVNLTIVDAFVPGLGVGGRASGSIDFSQAGSAFPQAEAHLAIRNLTRSTAGTVSQPVDANLIALLEPSRASLRAVMRTRGTVIGRIQAFADPLGPGRSWTQRISGAPVSGGIRYVGPADTLFSFAGLADQSLSGPLGVAADFGCRVANPCLRGIVRGRNLTYQNLTYGTQLTNMTLRGQFSGERLVLQQLTANAGDGVVTGSGYISLAADRGYPANIDLKLNGARLASSEDLRITASGDLQLIKAADEAPVLTGTVRLPSTRYRFVKEGSAQVPKLTGVRFKSPRGAPRVTGEAMVRPSSALGDVRLDLRIVAPNELFVSGMGLESEWRADLNLSGSSSDPRIAGSIELIRGTLSFAGRSFALREGRIRFLGGGTESATISLSGTETIEDVDVTLNVSGSVADPQIAFSSTPGLPQDEIMARVLFGDSIGSLSTLQAVQLAASLNTLRGSGGGLNPLGKLRSAAGFDRLRILGADQASGRGTALGIGKYITNDIYLEVVTDARGFTATQLEVTLSRSLSILSQAGGTGGTNVSIRYRKRY